MSVKYIDITDVEAYNKTATQNMNSGHKYSENKKINK